MPWCPKCKNEYRDGIRICVDCGCELVEEEQSDGQTAVIFGEKEQMDSLKNFLEYNKLTGISVRFDESENMYELFVQKEDKDSAADMARIFLSQEAQRVKELQEAEAEECSGQEETGEAYPDSSQGSEQGEADGEEAGSVSSVAYLNNTERAEDNKSSAWTLLFVGAVGLIVMILGMTEVIPLRVGNSYMFYGVMIAVFLLFMVMGVVSMKNARIFAKKAESENTLKDAMVKWYQENLNGADIDAELEDADGIAAEVLYFKRVQKLKEKFNHQYMNLDQAFLENFIDEEVYDNVFSDGDKAE